MKKYSRNLTSCGPMLMNKFSFGRKDDKIGVDDVEGLSDANRTKAIAELTTYRNGTGQLIIPGANLHRGLISAAMKVKKGKGNFSTTVASAVIGEDLLLTDKNGKPLKDFVTDIRRGKNPSTGGSVPIIRARIDEWRGALKMSYNEKLIKDTDLDKIVEALGHEVGFLDFNPLHKGSFGQFDIAA
jgi:hypothetical protein